jgi:hypothetical protein
MVRPKLPGPLGVRARRPPTGPAILLLKAPKRAMERVVLAPPLALLGVPIAFLRAARGGGEEV